MLKPPIPPNEAARVAALRALNILDSGPEAPFDDLAMLASHICQTPIALVTLVDSQRQWFKSHVGLDVAETGRDVSFCGHAILRPTELMVVPDTTADSRFADNPLVTGDPHVRFYAGAPLMTRDGHAMGTLCVADRVPRQLRPDQLTALAALARQVVSQLELRRAAAQNAWLCAASQQAAAHAAHNATHDPLTGLPNRALFTQRVAQSLARVRSEPSYRFSVMFVDLDRFKMVNDSLGHAAGDLLLQTVAHRLEACIASRTGAAAAAAAATATPAPQHTVARFGGDEFTLLLDGIGDAQTAATIATDIIRSLARPFLFDGQPLHSGASVGIVAVGPDYTEALDVLRDADVAMYRAKSSGKNRHVTFDAAMHQQAVERLRLENDLRGALARDEMLLHYQPVVSLDTRDVIGFEALLRWRRDGGPLVSPAEFIPVAEETGEIVPLGRWVLAQAIGQVAQWHRAFPHRPPVTVAVNLSRRQLQDAQLVSHVRQLLGTHAVPPATLMLEITESIVMDDAADARAVLDQLRALGVRLAMDDFGTGYSSLSCLQDFAVDVLKVDRAFVANLDHRRDAAVLHAVINLAHDLGITVVAEGIETMEQVSFLQAVGCDYGQGYLFARPLPVDEATTFLAAERDARSPLLSA